MDINEASKYTNWLEYLKSRPGITVEETDNETNSIHVTNEVEISSLKV